jgi:altronate dehydratase large subunit
LARELVLEASRVHRTSCSVQHLNLSVKCGVSDATSGVAGNPVIGMVFDKLIDAGGTAFFSETTELIGGEQMIADRAVNQQVRQDILNAVHNIEEKVKSIGEDIRSINPVPSNIAAGITTLEEKSIGAIAKSGSQPIQGVLNYGECPTKAGLYFVDAWMSAVSLPLTYAAAGSQLFIFQMGGGDLPEKYPAMPAVSSPVVSPVMYVTGNKETYAKADDSMDFNSSSVMDGTLSIEETADNMLECIIDIASGTWTKSESWNYRDQLEYYLTEPCF